MWLLYFFCFVSLAFAAESPPDHPLIPGLAEFRGSRDALDHPVGRCCYEDIYGSCFQLTELECIYYGGNWQPGDCSEPCDGADWGRCCLPNPGVECFNITPFECYGQGGHGWLPWIFCNGEECGTTIHRYCCGADSACFAEHLANGESFDEACGNCNGNPRTLRYEDPEPCVERSLGRCCYENNHCVESDSVMCANLYGGVWTADAACYGMVCRPPWIDPPQNLIISSDFPDVVLRWNSSFGAAAYLIYRSSEIDSLAFPQNFVGTTADTSFTDTDILNLTDKKLFYAITAATP